jgi:hypothetical protein
VVEEGRCENKVMQPANTAANATDNAPANPAANALANALANAAGNAANNAANAANIQGDPAPNPRHNAGAQPPPVQADRAEGSWRHRIRDEVEIARRANYDCEQQPHPSYRSPDHARPGTPATCPVQPGQWPSRGPLHYPY